MKVRVKPSPFQTSVLNALKDFRIVDAHEHLPPERIRLEQNVDVFTLFTQYPRRDLLTSGMPQEYWEKIQNSKIPIHKRWKIFAPYFRNIRYGSYARPALIVAREFYGFDDINEKNCRLISERISAGNTPGIYHRILREKCKIRVALNDVKSYKPADYSSDLLMPLMRVDNYADVRSKESVQERARDLGEKVKTLEDYLELTRRGLENWKSQGVVGIKMISRPYVTPKRSRALKIFDRIMRHERELESSSWSLASPSPANLLHSFLVEEMLHMAAELGLVAAVHTGMGAHAPAHFPVLDPRHMINIIGRHPKTRFDIYHMGIPYVRETAVMAKNFPNVWLNLCWCHIISPRITCTVLDELIDLVPVNKIIAFGGDYGLPVENIYGHLVMARENIAKVLGQRIMEGILTENEAIGIAMKWFYENPKNLYL